MAARLRRMKCMLLRSTKFLVVVALMLTVFVTGCTDEAISNEDTTYNEEGTLADDPASEDEQTASDDLVTDLARGLKSPELEERRSAATALGELGSEAAPAVPALIEALADNQTEVVWAVRAALEQIGSAAIDDLVALLNEPARSWTMHWSAIRVLERISSPEDTAVVVALIRALNADVHNVRASAAGALGRLTAEAAVPHLVTVVLDDPDASVRVAAIEALGSIGEATDEALGVIGVALGDTDFSVALAAQRALRGMGEDQERVAYAMIYMLEEGQISISQFRDTLRRMGTTGVEPILATLDTETEIMFELVETLGILGQRTSNVVETLVRFAGDQEQQWEVRSVAVSGLINIGTTEAVERLCTILVEPDSVGGQSIAYQLLPAVLRLHARDPRWLAEQPHVVASLGALLKDSEDMSSDVDVYLEQLREGYLATSKQLFIAPDGSDYWAGRHAEQNAEQTDGPFATFARVLQEIRNIKEVGLPDGGITVLVREGRYQEYIDISGLEGTASSPIAFRAYAGENVVLDGREQIDSEWVQHQGNIFKTNVETEMWQLFVEDQMVIGARWPNASFADDSIWYTETSRRVMHENSQFGSIRDTRLDAWPGSFRHLRGVRVDETLASTGIDFTGGVVVIGSHWWTWAADILEHAAGSSQFTYDTDFPRGYMRDFAPHMLEGGWGWAPITYHVMGLMALTTSNEWWYDKDTKTVYLWAPQDQDPNSLSVRGTVRDYNLSIEDSKYVSFDGFSSIGGAFRVLGSENVVIENGTWTYSSYPKIMLGEYGTFLGNRVDRSSHVLIRNLEISYNAGIALRVWDGSGNLVDNGYIHHNSWIPLHNGGTVHALGAEIRQSTIHTVGGPDGIWKPGIARLNRVYNIGGLLYDVAAIQTGNATHFAYTQNWVSQARLHGARFDDEVYHGNYSRNVIWDTLVNSIKGNDHLVYNNTTHNVLATGDIEIAKDFQSEFRDDGGLNTRTVITNNLVRLSSASWNIVDLPGTVGTNFTQPNGASSQLRDPNNLDFRPRAGSAIIEAGSFFEIPDTYQGPLFDMDWVVGEAPDMGAYEYGADYYWIPGHRREHASTPIPPHNATKVKQDADLMFLEAYQAVEHRIYFGENANNLEQIAIVRDANIIAPGLLQSGRTYFWRVDAVMTDGTVVLGPVWEFAVE